MIHPLISPWVVIGVAGIAGLLATIFAYFMAKAQMPDESNGESGYAEDMAQEKAWKKKKKDLGGWA